MYGGNSQCMTFNETMDNRQSTMQGILPKLKITAKVIYQNVIFLRRVFSGDLSEELCFIYLGPEHYTISKKPM